MTISTTENRYQYTGDGSTVAFAFPRYFEVSTHLVVYVDATLKTIGTHYSVSGADNDGGGTVTFLTAPGSGAVVTISRAEPYTQTVATETIAQYKPGTIEDGLTRRARAEQRLAEEVGRALQVPIYGDATEPFAAGGRRITGLGAATSAGDAVRYEDLVALSLSAATAFVQAGVGTVSRTALAKLQEWVSVKDYGAVGDGVTDDTAAIQAAIDSTKDVWFPEGDYVFTTLTMDNLGQHFHGAGSARAEAGGVRLITAVTSGNAIAVEAPDVVIERLWIEGPGRASGLEDLIHVERPGTTAADLDFIIKDCVLDGADVALYVNGRGLLCYHNIFNDTRKHIELDFPATISAPTEFGNSDDGGARKYIISGNYFHSASTASIVNEGAQSRDVHAIHIVDNYQDARQRFFRGDLYQSLIANNHVYRLGLNAIEINDRALQSSIIGNVFMGDRALSSAYDLDRMKICLLIDEDCVVDGLVFNDNQIGFNDRSCVVFNTDSSTSNSQFCNNTFIYVCLANDTLSSDIFEIISGAGLARVDISNNRCYTTLGMTNAATSYFFNRGGSATFDAVVGVNNQKPVDFGEANGLPMTNLPMRLFGTYVWLGSSVLRFSNSYPATADAGSAI